MTADPIYQATGEAMEETGADQPAWKPPPIRKTSFALSEKVLEDLDAIKQGLERERKRAMTMNEVLELLIDHWEST
jgi:hypothetical protein